MDANPVLSIVVITWNTRDLTLRGLASVAEGCGGYAHELIVVDNGSSDGTAEAVRRAFPGASIVENGRNLGFAAAANRGWRRAKGEFVLFLNSDARLEPGAARVLADFLRAAPRAGIAGAQLYFEDGRPQNSIDNVPTLATECLNKSLLRRLFPGRYPSKHQARAEPFEAESVIGACVAARRETLDRLDGFDEGFFFFLEETDLCLRARQAGWGVFLVPAARAVHLQGQSARKRRVPSRIEYHRSRNRFFRKHSGAAAALFLSAVSLGRLAVQSAALGIACLASAFALEKVRDRFRVSASLLAWYLAGCPRGWGLSGGAS